MTDALLDFLCGYVTYQEEKKKEKSIKCVQKFYPDQRIVRNRLDLKNIILSF